MKGKKIFFIWLCIAIIIIILGVFWKLKNNQNAAVEENSNQATSSYEVESQNTTDNPNEILTISQITEDMEGERVNIKGKVNDIRKHQNGHLFLTVIDNTGSITVPIFANTNINQNMIINNNTYKISGKVDIYNGELEIIPETQDDIKQEEQNTSQLPITEENIDKQTTIKCTIESKYDHPNGHIFLSVLTDNGEDIDVPIFNTLKYDYDNYLKPGTYLEIKGKISKYNDRLEVIPNTKNDITIISEGDSYDVELVSLSDITNDNRGQEVQVRGIPVDINITSKGHAFLYLKDNQNNKLKAVLFKADTNEIQGRLEKLQQYSKSNNEVRVLGTIDVYEGELELIIDKVFNND